MKKVSLLLAVLVALAFTATAGIAGTLEEIQKRGKLRVGMEPGYMPFELKNQKGEIIGFDVDMANRMAKAMGVELELVDTAWDGIIPALLTGKFDVIMSGMTLTQERNMSINFAPPYIVIGQSILSRRISPAPSNPTRISTTPSTPSPRNSAPPASRPPSG
jgi:polar amino acid transport system substrate-binding protein